MSIVVFLASIILFLSTVVSFTIQSIHRSPSHVAQKLKMEYIPDGLTRKQWDELKKKETEKKQMGALGTTKFKSRSFEAWQKSGAKHLFPVNPNEVPYEERPYMQRKNGDWEGKDLGNVGLKGKGQGAAYERNVLDDVYEAAKKKGKLNSASILGSGEGLPWTFEQAQKLSQANSVSKVVKKNEIGLAGKQKSPEELAALKAKLVKPVVSKKDTIVTPTEEKPKKFFGLF